MKKWQIAILSIICFLIQIILTYFCNNYLSVKKDIDHYFLDGYSTSLYASDSTQKKYKITNQEELDLFQLFYSDCEFKKENDFSKNTIFVQKNFENDTSNEYLFWGAYKRNNKIVFDDFEYSWPWQTTSICVSGYNYYVAIIPNNRLKSINVEEWSSPKEIKEVKDNNNIHYELWCKDMEFRDSYKIIEENLRNSEDVFLSSYSDNRYYLKSTNAESMVSLKKALYNKDKRFDLYISEIDYGEKSSSTYTKSSNVVLNVSIFTKVTYNTLKDGVAEEIAQKINGTVDHYYNGGFTISISNIDLNSIENIESIISNYTFIEEYEYVIKWNDNI